MTLEPHEVQPGALDENREPLQLTREGGESVTVVDRFQAGRGGYLIVDDGTGALSLLNESTVLEEFSPVEVANAQEEENERLRQRIAELEAQGADTPNDTARTQFEDAWEPPATTAPDEEV